MMRLFYLFVFLVLSHVAFADLTVYVTNTFAGSGDITQIPIDAAGTPTLGATTPSQGNSPNDLAITPNGKFIYVTTSGGVLEQFAINPFTGVPVFVGELFFGAGGLGNIAITPDGRYAYVVIPSSNQITQVILDSVTGEPTIGASLILGASPLSIEVAPDGNNAYVGDDTGTLSQIILNPATGAPSLGMTAPFGSGMLLSLTISPDGNNVYAIVTGINPNQIAQFDIASGAPVFVTSIGAYIGQLGLADIDIAPNGENAYYVDSPTASVTQVLIDPMSGNPTLGVVASTNGLLPEAIVVAPNGANAYVTNQISSEVVQISLDSAGVPSFVTALSTNGSFPFNIAITTTSFSPPQSSQKRNRFLTQTDIVNMLTWQAFGPAQSYSVYRDAALTNLAGSVPAASPTVEFQDHNRKKNKTYTYYIVANTGSGAVFLGAITVPPS